MTTKIQDNGDLLTFLVSQADSSKNWFGFTQQRITAIALAHDIARRHADKMTPKEVVDYATALNQAIYEKIIKGRW
jgi:two-component sensor histidine kinase